MNNPADSRLCTGCGVLKTLENFYFLPSTGYYRSNCKGCDSLRYHKNKSSAHYRSLLRIRQLSNSYGITIQQFNDIFTNQGMACAICKIAFDNDKRTPCVDHCHITQEVRGLLCRSCNLIIGKAFDSPKVLRSAIHYLQKENNP